MSARERGQRPLLDLVEQHTHTHDMGCVQANLNIPQSKPPTGQDEKPPEMVQV